MAKSMTQASPTAAATVRRGETALFESVREATARIYDEEYDYTREDRLEVICR